MDTLVALVTAILVSVFFLRGYLKRLGRREELARKAAQKGKLYSSGPRSQHPHIDANSCIGCATCTSVCPEGDVLGMIGGKAAIINGHKCIGHSLCAEACPVGAITMVMGSPSMGADLPLLTPEYETTVPNLFIVGELGGLALIKNAVNQGRDCVDIVGARLAQKRPLLGQGDVYDVLIVGAGPAGISASLRAIETKLSYVTLEQDEVGGTVAKFPRQKIVMTSPVQFPMYGKFTKTELSKEHLLAFWDMVLNRSDFNVRTGEKVEDIRRGEDDILQVHTANNLYRARAVILALGRTGTPRKLGVKGEELPKVMYRLIEADHYSNKRILVVGGGDSAVEAAMGLAHQSGNQVTLSYRGEEFIRIKQRNAQRLNECLSEKRLTVLLGSNPVEFKESTVTLDIKGQHRELANDFVFIFAGGSPPTHFLKKIGVGFGKRDLTLEVSAEAKQEQSPRPTPAPSLDETASQMLTPVLAASRVQATPNIPGSDLPKVSYHLLDAQAYSGKDVLVVGSGDAAVNAALALSHSARNRVTLVCENDFVQLSRSRSRDLLDAAVKEGRIVPVLQATVFRIEPTSAEIQVNGFRAKIPNHCVFILPERRTSVSLGK